MSEEGLLPSVAPPILLHRYRPSHGIFVFANCHFCSTFFCGEHDARSSLSLSIFTWARVVHASSTPTRNVTSSRVFHRVDIEDLSDNVHRWPDKMTKWWNESKRGRGGYISNSQEPFKHRQPYQYLSVPRPRGAVTFFFHERGSVIEDMLPPPPLLFLLDFSLLSRSQDLSPIRSRDLQSTRLVERGGVVLVNTDERESMDL